MNDADNASALWVQELVAGNDEVVEEFWNLYGPNLQRLAKSRMSPGLQRRLGPEDVVQSVCRTFVRRAQLGEFHLEDRDALWRLLCAITLTKVRQHARFHYRKRRGVNQEESVGHVKDVPREHREDRFASSEPTPDEAVAFAEQMQHLFDDLDEEERRLIQLKLDGVDPNEIAKALGCSKRTVRRLSLQVRTRWENALVNSLDG